MGWPRFRFILLLGLVGLPATAGGRAIIPKT